LTQPWQKQADGSLLRRTADLRLVVQPHSVSGAVRFLLIREPGNRPGAVGALIRSGYRQTVACAMAAAEAMATQLMVRVSASAFQDPALAVAAMPA
jgi:hypothetical protein